MPVAVRAGRAQQGTLLPGRRGSKRRVGSICQRALEPPPLVAGQAARLACIFRRLDEG